MKCPRAMVLRNEIDDPLRQTHFAGELCTVCNMADYDLCALRRLQTVVRVLFHLIFDEMFRGGRLAYVVVQSSDACQEAVPAYDAASFFSKLSDSVRVLIRSGRTQS